MQGCPKNQVLSDAGDWLTFTAMVGLNRLELLTSRLSGVRSNQLSYRPILCLKI